MVDREMIEKYHCNYCGEELVWFGYFRYCPDPKCPAFALLQVPVELLIKKKNSKGGKHGV